MKIEGNAMTADFYESALDCLQENKYGAAAKQLEKVDEPELQAECERLSELMGNHSEMVGGALGMVLSNYKDRLIDDLAQKLEEGDDDSLNSGDANGE